MIGLFLFGVLCTVVGAILVREPEDGFEDFDDEETDEYEYPTWS